MAKYIADSTDLTSIANAIRAKGETSESLSFPNGFVSAINAIDTGGGGGGGGGFEPPAGCEIGVFTPSENENTHTVTHNLGAIPKIAVCLCVPNKAYTSMTTATIMLEALGADPATGEFIQSNTSTHKIDTIVQANTNDGEYFCTTNSYTSYPAAMTATSVTFVTGRYYSGKFMANEKYLYILIK